MSTNTVVSLAKSAKKRTPSIIAAEIYEQKKVCDAAQATLNALKSELTAFGPQSYEIKEAGPGAKVEVTRASNGGPTGKIKTEFSVEAFFTLSEVRRTELQQMGVVKMVPEVSKGAASQVRVHIR